MERPSPELFEYTMYDISCPVTGRYKARLARQKWFNDICDRVMLDLIEKQRQTLPDNKCVLTTASEYELQSCKILQKSIYIADLQCDIVNKARKD